MTAEDRLRDAAKAYVDQIQPAPDAWARIRERVDIEPRRPRRSAGRLALAGFATAVMIALVVTLVTVVRDDGNSGTGVTAGPSGELPEQIVAVTEDGRVVVLDAATGAEVRQLATGADSGSAVTVAPDGSRVFYDRAVSASTSCSQSREIVSVLLDGGEPELVAPAASAPAVSPDGRMLAYLEHAGPSGCSVPQSLVVQEIDGSRGAGWTLEGGEGQYLTRPAWAPDSRHLAFVIAESEEPKHPRVIDTETAQSLDDARLVELAENVGWLGYLGGTGEFLGVVLSDGTDASFRAVGLDESGRLTRDLFSATGTVSEPVVADASGTNVLIRTGPDSDSESLYRWREGETGLVNVRDGIVAAVWLQGAALPAPAPVPDPLDGLVAATDDGRIVVLDSTTGEEGRVIAEGADAETVIAVTPDGERVFFDRPPTTGGQPREIVTVPTSGGEAIVIVGESGQPSVSRDGTKLAFVHYGRQPDGAWKGSFLEVITTASALATPERLGYWAVGDVTQELARPSWAPDSRHLVYTLLGTREGSYPRTLDTEQDIPLDQAPIVPIVDGSAVGGYLGTTGELLGSWAAPGDDPDQRLRAVAIDPQSGAVTRELFRHADECCAPAFPFVSDPSGRHVVTLANNLRLYRWSEGDPDPTPIGDGILVAVWLPGS